MGGPGIRVTQFGGGAPRRRPRPGEPQQEQPQQSTGSIIASLLPILLLFLWPLLSSIFSGSGTVGPAFTLDKATPPYTKALKTRDLKIPYWVNPSDYRDLSRGQKDKLERRVEVKLVSDLNFNCEQEQRERDRLFIEAQGWWSVDERKMEKARKHKMPACDRLQQLKNGI
jgi:DnaJ homolog subfamily B member 12